MKILHVIAPAPAGGAESAIRSLAIGQRELGHEVEVATLTSRTTGEHPFVERLRADGLPVTDIRSGRMDYLAESRAIGTLLAKRRADVLHTHVYHADVVGYVGASQLGIPHVATMHGFTGGSARLAAYQKIDMWVLRRCAAVLAVSPNVRESALTEGLSQTRVHHVPNGYQPSLVQPLDRAAAREALDLPDKLPVVGWVGRLSEEKGGDLAICAFAQMTPRTTTLAMLGDGPERVNLELIARHQRLGESRVRFAGRVNDAARYMAAFDVLLLSSRTEGTPMVLLEAMAAGVQIVSFGVGGVPAMLSADSALLVTPGDLSALARALTFAIACPVAARKRVDAARRIYEERFSVKTCATRVLDIYSQVIRERSESRGAAEPAKRSPRLLPTAREYRWAGM